MNQTTLLAQLRRCAIVASTILFLGLASPVSATVMTFPLSIEYSGSSPPAGSAPWLTAIFDDENTPGTVKLKLIASNLTGNEFVSVWNFNLNPNLSPADIAFSAPTKVGSFADPTVSKTVNAFSAGPDASYDIEFSFSLSGMGGGTQRFGAGESAEYTITGSGGAAGLVVADFNFLSQPGNGGVGGPFLTGAHVQSINGEDSGWITVLPGLNPFDVIPEPSSLALLTLSLCGLAVRRKL